MVSSRAAALGQQRRRWSSTSPHGGGPSRQLFSWAPLSSPHDGGGLSSSDSSISIPVPQTSHGRCLVPVALLQHLLLHRSNLPLRQVACPTKPTSCGGASEIVRSRPDLAVRIFSGLQSGSGGDAVQHGAGVVMSFGCHPFVVQTQIDFVQVAFLIWADEVQFLF